MTGTLFIPFPFALAYAREKKNSIIITKYVYKIAAHAGNWLMRKSCCSHCAQAGTAFWES